MSCLRLSVSVSISACLYLCLSYCLIVCLSVCLYVCLCLCLSLSPSICLSLSLSLSLSLFLSLSLSLPSLSLSLFSPTHQVFNFEFQRPVWTYSPVNLHVDNLWNSNDWAHCAAHLNAAIAIVSVLLIHSTSLTGFLPVYFLSSWPFNFPIRVSSYLVCLPHVFQTSPNPHQWKKSCKWSWKNQEDRN